MTAQEAKSRIATLRKELHEHNHRYHVLNKPLITDAEYDRLFRELVDIEKAWPAFDDPNSPTKRVGSPAVSTFAKVKHGRKMLSLDNAFSTAELAKFFNHPDMMDWSGTVEPKIDGLSLSIRYENGRMVQAITRGDGVSGDDVTENAKTITSIPLVLDAPLNLEVRGEVYMSHKVFEELNAELRNEGDEEFANPRNAAAGALKNKDSREVAKRKLGFIAWAAADPITLLAFARKHYKQVFDDTHEQAMHVLVKLGFVTTLNYFLPVENFLCTSFCVDMKDEKHLLRSLEWGEQMRQIAPFATDGLVFKFNGLKTQNELGEGTRAPNWAIAFKFPPERKVTKIVDIEVSIGRHGTLTPTAVFNAIRLSGSTVQRASLCNQDEIERLGVSIGDEVYVEKSAEIIPKVMGVSKKNVADFWKMPMHCPHCGTTVAKEKGKVAYYCPNPKCEAQITERLIHTLGKQCLDWDGMGEETITKLVREYPKVTSLHDLLVMDNATILKAFKSAASKKFISERERAKKAPLWRKIHALGIEKIGKSLSQDICAKWRSMTAIIDDIQAVTTMLGDVVGQNFVDFIVNHGDEITTLEADGYLFEDDAQAVGPLTGKVFCITGAMASGPRPQIEKLIEQHGGTCKSSVSKKVDFLVNGPGGGENKAAAARKNGTAILTEAQLYEMMGIPMPTDYKNVLEVEGE